MFFKSHTDRLFTDAETTADLMDRLQKAWRMVKRSGGAPGGDGVNIGDFACDCDQRLQRIAGELIAGRYRFSRLRAVDVPKANGKLRRLEIPTVGDRVVLQAIRVAFEPDLESAMGDCSHAFRPRRGAHTAIEVVQNAIRNQHFHVVKTDIESFFPSIRHAILFGQLWQRLGQPKSRLLRDAVQISSGWRPRRKGIAQGSPLSPLLANSYLIDFDDQLQQQAMVYVRYADDLLLLCKDDSTAKTSLDRLSRLLSELGLRLSRSKTHRADIRHSPIDYLGFCITASRIVPSESNVTRLNDAIAHWLSPRQRIKRSKRTERLNSILHSFAWYYQIAQCSDLLKELDQTVSRHQKRLAAKRKTQAPQRNQLVRLTALGKAAKPTSCDRKQLAKWNGYGS